MHNANHYRNLVELPNEILIKILEYINIHELSANVGTCCQKLYYLIIKIINKRLDLRYPNNEGKDISNEEYTYSQPATDKALERICISKEAAMSVSYLILQVDVLLFNRYNFYNPAVHFRNSYELLEASDNLEEWEKVTGIGIICPFPSQNILACTSKKLSISS